MKELTLYICEICGERYKDKQLAKDCESKHLVPKAITGQKYSSDDKKKQYPESINVSFEGTDKIITYYRMEGYRRG